MNTHAERIRLDETRNLLFEGTHQFRRAIGKERSGSRQHIRVWKACDFPGELNIADEKNPQSRGSNEGLDSTAAG